MTKQEEIDWGLRKFLSEWTEQDGEQYLYDFSLALRGYLHSQGVVIKVERELPDWKEADCIGGGAKLAQQDMLDNNWRCVESLLDKDNPV